MNGTVSSAARCVCIFTLFVVAVADTRCLAQTKKKWRKEVETEKKCHSSLIVFEIDDGRRASVVAESIPARVNATVATASEVTALTAKLFHCFELNLMGFFSCVRVYVCVEFLIATHNRSHPKMENNHHRSVIRIWWPEKIWISFQAAPICVCPNAHQLIWIIRQWKRSFLAPLFLSFACRMNKCVYILNLLSFSSVRSFYLFVYALNCHQFTTYLHFLTENARVSNTKFISFFCVHSNYKFSNFFVRRRRRRRWPFKAIRLQSVARAYE